MDEMYIDVSGGVAFLPGTQSLVQTGTGKVAAKNATGDSATTANPSKKSSNTWNNISFWGTDNLFPQNVVKECEINTLIPSSLDIQINALYGKGVVACRVVDLKDDGTEVVEAVKDPAVLEFWQANQVNRYLFECYRDLAWYFNAFPEILLSMNRKQILKLRINQAAWCRYEKINPATGMIENVFVSGEWPKPAENNFTKVAALDGWDTYYDLQLRQDGEFKYIIPLSYDSVPDKRYYALAYWDGVRSNGYLEIANSIPGLKKALLKNQMTIKYHIKIPSSYWTSKYREWDSFTDTEQAAKIKLKLNELNTFLSGTENTGKSFISPIDVDSDGKALPGWEIIPLEDRLKDGKHLIEAQAANSEILFALHMDPSILGVSAPGNASGGNGAGSGSDKREGFLIKTALLQAKREVAMRPLYLIRDYNGWSRDIQFRTLDTVLTTLDSGAGSKKVLS